MTLAIPEKLALTLLLVVAALTSPWYANALLVVVMLLARLVIPALRPTDNKASRRFRKVFGVLLLLVAVMIFLNGLLIRTGAEVVDFAITRLYEGGIQFGLMTGCRLLLLATAFLVFFGSTRITDFADYLNRIGLPTPILTTLLLSLHFVDHLPDRIGQIFTAQESRGAPVRGSIIARIRSFFVVLTPLILSSIVESIERGTALELRGFHSGVSLRAAGGPPERSPWSVRTIVLLVLALLLALFRIATWLTPSP